MIVFAKAGPINYQPRPETEGYFRIMKIFPKEDRKIPYYSRHVRDANHGWVVQPNVNKDGEANTSGSLSVQKTFGDHEVHASASSVFAGPRRGWDTYNIGATFNW